MSSIVKDLIRKDAMLGKLMSMAPEDRYEVIRQIKETAQNESRFKKGELVYLCHSPGISLVGSISELPHDHDDPTQHSYSRVLGWSCFGDLQVAVPYYNNPHCGECTWGDEKIQPVEGPDWKVGSMFKPGMELSFKWDQDGWDHRRVGDITRARLVEAHLKRGDWFVEYEKPCGAWITRVVNEQYFIVS